MTAPRLYKVAEVAELLSCSKDHVYDLIAAGRLAKCDIGTGRRPLTRVSEKALTAYIERNTRKSGAA